MEAETMLGCLKDWMKFPLAILQFVVVFYQILQKQRLNLFWNTWTTLRYIF